jgi:hypothetical protein
VFGLLRTSKLLVSAVMGSKEIAAVKVNAKIVRVKERAVEVRKEVNRHVDAEEN